MNIIYEIITYVHLIGFALGFGGAMVSDTLFFSSIKDQKITKTEFRFIHLGGTLVWLGVSILVLSGIGLVLLNPQILQSSKFLLKMVVVGVIVINGMLVHLIHLPYLKRHIGVLFSTLKDFKKRGTYLVLSGGVSVVSWFSAALLGSLPGLSFSFVELLVVYGVLLCSAMIGGITMQHIFFKMNQNGKT